MSIFQTILTVTFVVLVFYGLVTYYSPVHHEGLSMNQVPLNIFQTWHDKNLQPKMQECVETLKKENPEFTHYLFDDAECETFLTTYFNNDVVDAYRTLIPGPYKADLWRYCVLYIHGGIYLDIKYKCVNGYQLKNLMYEEHFCKDIKYDKVIQGVYNACLICKAGNKVLKQCIDKVVENVQQNFYGSTLWDITGPTMMTQFLNEEQLKQLDELVHVYDQEDKKFYIKFKGEKVLQIYPEYCDELTIYRNVPHYDTLWSTRSVYKDQEGKKSPKPIESEPNRYM